MRRRQKSRHPTLAAVVHASVGIDVDVDDDRDDDADMGRNDLVPVSDRLTNEVESFNDDNDYNSNADNENDNDGNDNSDDSEGLKK